MIDAFKKMSWASRRMIAVMLILSVIIIICGAVVYNTLDIQPLGRVSGGSFTAQRMDAVAFAYGVIFLLIINIIKIILSENAANEVIKMSAEGSKSVSGYIQMQAMSRFALTVGALLAAAFIPFIDVFGAVFGALVWQIAVYSVKYSKKAAQ